MRGERQPSEPTARLAVWGLALLASVGIARADTTDPFPELRPHSRAHATQLLVGAGASGRCLTPQVQQALSAGTTAPVARRASLMLQRRSSVAHEQVWTGAHDVRIRYAVAEAAFDRIAPLDEDRDGTPDLLESVAHGLAQGRAVLVDRLGLAAPERLEVWLLELGDAWEGYALDRPGAPTIVLDATPAGGAEQARRAALHQYAHAVVFGLGAGFPAEWAEALATWTVIAAEGRPDEVTAATLSARAARMGAGLTATDLGLAAGNALWLAFLDEAYGPPTLRLTLDELSRATVADALDQGLRRSTGDDLTTALREFQLWALLVGDRTDGDRFSFARQLASPRFASQAEGLPALSILADAAVAPWGTAAVRLEPERRDGGLRVQFEGEFPAAWQADLILVDGRGGLRRLAMPLTPEGRGQAIIPLHDVAEVVLLARHLGGDDSAARRYTYTAHHERTYPFEITTLAAVVADPDQRAVLVSWETASEQQLVGFNIVRTREGADAAPSVVVNPVWMPALGDGSGSTWYHFADASVEPGVTYQYRIEGITADGLRSLSEPVLVRQPRRD